MRKRWKCITALCLMVLLGCLMPVSSMNAAAETSEISEYDETQELAEIAESEEILPDDAADKDNGETPKTEDILSDDKTTTDDNVMFDPDSTQMDADKAETDGPESLDTENGESETSDAGDKESGTLGGDGEESEDDNDNSEDDIVKITETNFYYLQTDTPYQLGDGEWMVYGYPTVYNGGIIFYVEETGVCFLYNAADWERFAW